MPIKDPIKRAEYERKRYQENPSRAIANAEWRARNPEKSRAIGRRCAAKYPEKIKAWQDANPEKVKAAKLKYEREHKAEKAIRTRNRQAELKGATIESFNKEQLAKRMAEFGNQCVYCSGPYEHVDHAIPLSRGGLHSLSNLVPSCASCNLRKGTKTHTEFLGGV